MSKPRYIAHTTGKQPVGDDVIVEVAFRDGHVITSFPAKNWVWNPTLCKPTIIAYRVIKE